MSQHQRPTVQPRAGTLQRLREVADAEVMHGDRVNSLAAGRFEDAMPTPRTFVSTGRCRLACHERPCSEDGSMNAGAQTVSSGGYVRPDGVAAATQATLSAAAGLEVHGGTGTGENPPNNQVRKDGPSRVLSSLFPRVWRRRLYVMNAHTLEQPADASSADTYRYLLSHYGPLLTLKHLAEVLHSTPNGVRMTLARRREPFSVALSQSRRRLGRRVYFDAARVAKAIDAASGGRSPSCAGEDANEAIAGTWAGGFE